MNANGYWRDVLPRHEKTAAPSFRIPAGYTTAFELAIRFHHWWQSLSRDPTPAEIAEKWGITRSTAYRWRDGYKAAIGRIGVIE